MLMLRAGDNGPHGGVGAWFRRPGVLRGRCQCDSEARRDWTARLWKARVHPKYKTKYRVTNWPTYDRALVRQGDITVWLSPEAIAAWTPARIGKRGGQRRYSGLAIETALALRLVFHLPLRQTEGFLASIFEVMGVDLDVPVFVRLTSTCRESASPVES